ncbi:MAG: ABC transporter substrate-binding protein [Actinomycetota bacterium]
MHCTASQDDIDDLACREFITGLTAAGLLAGLADRVFPTFLGAGREQVAMRNRRGFSIGALLLLLAACSPGGNEEAGEQSKGELTVGVSGSFAENQIVAEMYAQVLENAGYSIERQLTLQRREISQPAIESGEIDLKPEYVGTLLVFLDPDAAASSDAAAVIGPLQTLLDARGLSALEPSPANDTNAFVVTKETADRFSLVKVSDLAPVSSQLTLAGPPECEERPFCIPGLRDTYGITFGKFERVGACDSATANVLDAGKADVALLCSTQSIIAAKGWVPLEDDKGLQKADNITPVIRKDKLNDEIAGLLNAVSAALSTEKITELNAKVELDQDDPEAVAREYLQEQGLI